LESNGGSLLASAEDHDYLMISVLGFGEPEQVSAAVEAMARKALARF
jgi:hypothetical protein